MEKVYGYIRVSTTKQGEGVSLQEQKSAIQEFARKKDLEILQWFEEKKTAAKEGRPIFNQMIKLLSKGKADGVCFHKIDRSSRNYGDWNKINILADAGVSIYSVSDGINLADETSRLPADILAAMSTHYIRNLRNETLKGFYGRLKQGLYPLPAPIGYIDKGRGNIKEIDPFYGSLIKKTFDLYCTNRYGIIDLAVEMSKRGLKSRTGMPVSKSHISRILRNPFYIGIMKIQKTGEVFIGAHQPIISKALFNKAQEILDGKRSKKIRKHNIPFRKMIKCLHCGYSLIGEVQKGHIYYRCHTKNCPTNPTRQEKVVHSLTQFISDIAISSAQLDKIKKIIYSLNQIDKKGIKKKLKGLKFKLIALDEKLSKLMDTLIEGLIENELFLQKKQQLINEKIEIREKVDRINQDKGDSRKLITKFLEQLKNLILGDKQPNAHDLAEMVRFATSNLQYNGEKYIIESLWPYNEVFLGKKRTYGDPCKDTYRTNDTLNKSKTLILTYKVDTPNKKMLKYVNTNELANSLIKIINE